jgi:[protein-PII] uridylyltransferase
MTAVAQARADAMRRFEGSERRIALTDVTDVWLTGIFEQASAQISAPSALIAVGGHGRRELAPGSDIDLLLLHRGNDQQAAQLAEGMWYPIWDAGLPLDHSVRTLGEARRVAASDIKAMLGLLDARLIAGDHVIVDQLRKAVLADWRAMSRQRVNDLRTLVDARRMRWGELVHMIEPDLKEAYGGLRETSILRGIAASWLTDIPHTDWPQAAEFLRDVRDELHASSGRRSDVLLLQDQIVVADAMGLSSPDELLRRVYEAARTIAFASDQSWYRLNRLVRTDSPRSLRSVHRHTPERVPLADGVVVHGGEVVLAHDAKPETDFGLILRAAAAAAQAGLPLSEHAVARFAQSQAPIPVPWPRPLRESFITLLGSGPALLMIWEGLDQAGIIERLIPGWQVIRSAPQRNPMHRFTVDRHLLEAVLQCQTRQVRRPDLLLVGALLHDFGKARQADHSEIGAKLAAELAPNMGFDDDETRTIVTLVRHHLLLPEVATKRDLEDPATVELVLSAVPAAQDIELLAALSRADALATGPSVSSEWRLGLIEDLARRCLRASQGLPQEQPPKLAEDEVFALQQPGLWIMVRHESDGCVITVAAPDTPGLLATVAGVLSVRHLHIRAARVNTDNGRALQIWHAEPLFGQPPSAEELTEDLRRALAGTDNPTERLAQRERSNMQREVAPPQVFVFNGGSSRETIVEVRSPDKPGLLHRIARALTEADLDIMGAKVDTRGADVVDVFFVRGRTGGQLNNVQSEQLHEALMAALRPES